MKPRIASAPAATISSPPPSPWRQLSRYQWLVLAVAWLGWVFDSMDATIYTLVMSPALKELLGERATPENIGWYGGVIFALFLAGWAAGGVFFGWVADRLGRARTLVITILIYAIFTGLAGFSHTWWELAIYRFLTALGIGGEWAAGATLVAEVWPESMRVKGAGLLACAWGAGYFLAAAINLLLAAQSWRVMFFVGVIPAFVAVLARLKVRESDRWEQARRIQVAGGSGRPSLKELFVPGTRRDTLVGSGLAFVAVFGNWSATMWTPTLVRELLAPLRLDAHTLSRLASQATMWLNAGAVVGYLAFAPMAEWLGRRRAFLVMLIGSAIMLPITFLGPRTYDATQWVLPLLGFFSNGIFTGFPIYLPEIFPTRIRATGAGFCFNAGRAVAATGPFLTGYLVGHLGSFARAASSMALIYILGMVILIFARETKGQAIQ